MGKHVLGRRHRARIVGAVFVHVSLKTRHSVTSDMFPRDVLSFNGGDLNSDHFVLSGPSRTPAVTVIGTTFRSMSRRSSNSARVSPSALRRALRLANALRKAHPDAHCALVHRNPFELLVATILSAQATDVSVNKVTPALFKAFPDARTLADASPSQVEPFIRTIGLYRNKSKSICGAAKMLVDRYGGEVPRTMNELVELPGVARKTANVVLGNCFGINEGFVVDTHIARLAVRFGLARAGDNVATIERKLMALFPRERWCELSHQIIWHGRLVCKARGGSCESDPICREFGIGCDKARPARNKPAREK